MSEQVMQDAMDRYSETRPAGYSQCDFVAGWEARAALAEQPAKNISGLGLAVIGVKHFGNPIPQAWYSAARELLAEQPAQGVPPSESIATDDDVERVARMAGWNNRRYMTSADYSDWCRRMREFVRLAAPPAPSVPDGLRAKLRSLALDLRRMVEKHPEHCGYITDRDQAMDWIAAEMAVLAAAPEVKRG